MQAIICSQKFRKENAAWLLINLMKLFSGFSFSSFYHFTTTQLGLKEIFW